MKRQIRKNPKEFDGILGREYHQTRKYVPHLDLLQDSVKHALRKYLPKRKGPIIVVEAGTGTGFTTRRILDAAPRIRVLSADISRNVLETAKENLREYGGRVTLLHADIQSVLDELPERSIDAFVSASTLHNIPIVSEGNATERWRIFSGMMDALKHRGLFVNADKYAYDDRKIQGHVMEQQLHLIDVAFAGQPELQKAWREHSLEDAKMDMTIEDQIVLLELMREGSFTEFHIPFRYAYDATLVAIKGC